MKRKVPLNTVVDDIRSRMTDEELKAKYDLPRRGLRALFKKLLDAHLISHSELHKTSALYREKIEQIKQRRNPRADLSVPLPIYDVGLSNFGIVRDISETGLCVAGIAAEVGDVKTFQLPIDNFMNADPLLLIAECRWAEKKRNKEKHFLAGFELLDLSETDRNVLKKVMDFLLLSNSGSWQTTASIYAGEAGSTGNE